MTGRYPAAPLDGLSRHGCLMDWMPEGFNPEFPTISHESESQTRNKRLLRHGVITCKAKLQ